MQFTTFTNKIKTIFGCYLIFNNLILKRINILQYTIAQLINYEIITIKKAVFRLKNLPKHSFSQTLFISLFYHGPILKDSFGVPTKHLEITGNSSVIT